MRETIFCKHFRSMSEHETCEAGVEYDSLKGIPFDKRPCFMRGKDRQVCGGCDLAEFPTVEEVAAQDAEFRKRLERIGVARDAIVKACGGPWKKGKPGSSGSIPCPCCDGGTLRYSRSGYNGHVHAGCTTEGCVRWME